MWGRGKERVAVHTLGLYMLQLLQKYILLHQTHLNKEKYNDYDIIFLQVSFVLCSNLGKYMGSAFGGAH